MLVFPKILFILHNFNRNNFNQVLCNAMSTPKLYCRFCAEEKPHTEITTLTSKDDQRTLTEKLSLIGVSFVDFSNKMLPQTACFACLELIKVSHEFFIKVKRSQVVLSELCGVEVGTEIGYTFPNCESFKEESDGEYLQDEPISSFDAAESLMKVEKYDNGETELFEKSMPVTVGSNVSRRTPVPRKSKKKQSWSTYPWQCSICGITVNSLKALREHCQADHVKCFAFKCADCDDQLNSFDGFVAHVKRHRKGLRNYCQYCNIKMEDRTHPKSHLTETCTLCGETFDDLHSLNSHLKLYTTGLINEIRLKNDIQTWVDYPSICQYCNLRVTDKDVLTEHCIEAHKRCFGNQCVDCSVSVASFKDFVEHVKSHRPYLKNICPYCDIQIGDEVLNHTEEHTCLHPCNVCGQLFQQKRQLRAHERLTLPTPLKPKKRPIKNDSSCAICGMIMKTPASLKAHLKTHTDRKRNYTCDRCGKAYYTKGSLDVHKKIHENNLRETCKICQKTFLTVPRLKKHVKTHNLEMQYQCDECKRFFNSKDRLREHVKVHMNIMPFQCQYCSKRFRHKSIMKTHENQHTGARPYSCNICCMEFANWSNCNKHMKRKHGTTLAKNVMTPHGKLALNPKTGKPDQLYMDNVVKEWSEMMLMGRDKGRVLLDSSQTLHTT